MWNHLDATKTRAEFTDINRNTNESCMHFLLLFHKPTFGRAFPCTSGIPLFFPHWGRRFAGCYAWNRNPVARHFSELSAWFLHFKITWLFVILVASVVITIFLRYCCIVVTFCNFYSREGLENRRHEKVLTLLLHNHTLTFIQIEFQSNQIQIWESSNFHSWKFNY